MEKINIAELFETSFSQIMEDPKEEQYPQSMNLIRSCAVEKNLEFDGYFKTRWEESANTIINFDEDYFEDPDRTELYVFLSAASDDEIFDFLQIVYHQLYKIQLTAEMISEKIVVLTIGKGVKF